MEAPINKYGFVDETHDCKVGISFVQTGESNMWGVATYDSIMIQNLVIAFFSTLTNFFMLSYYATHVQHPKFCIRWQRSYCLYLHMVSGVLEIFTGPILSLALTGPTVEYVVKTNAAISLLHSATALFQIPIVFGVHLFMKPAYFLLVLIKVLCAVNVWLNPFCYLRLIVLYNVLSTYSWCRVLMMVFSKLKIFSGSSYSVAIASAAAICLTGTGPATSSLFLVGILIYCWTLRLVYGKDNWKFQHLLGESSSNPFDNSAFETLFQEAYGSGGLCPFAKTDAETEKLQSGTESDMLLRPLFHHIDIDGDGMIGLSEMKQFALNIKQPKLYSTIVKSFHTDLDEYESNFFQKRKVVEQKIDYNRFRELAQGTVHNHKVPDLVERINSIKLMSDEDKKNDNKARLVFDIFDRGVSGYLTMQELGVVLIEFGLPHSEVRAVFQLFDKNHDGKLEFSEFKESFGALWKYAYTLFENRLQYEQDMKSRMNRVKLLGGDMLDAQSEIYLKVAREKSKEKHDRESLRKSRKNKNKD